MKKQSLDDQIENCLVMIAEVKAMPPRAFVERLSIWRCGSAACLGGWVAQHPHFRKKGVFPSCWEGAPQTKDVRDSFTVAEMLFGNVEIFSARQSEEQGSDKQVALTRLNNTLDLLLQVRL